MLILHSHPHALLRLVADARHREPIAQEDGGVVGEALHPRGSPGNGQNHAGVGVVVYASLVAGRRIGQDGAEAVGVG